MAKLSVDQTLSRAKVHAKQGDLEEAQHLYQLVSQSFPKNKRAQQGLAALNESEPKAASKSLPRDSINQLLNLYNQGQMTLVVEQAKELSERYSDDFVLWNILGAANKELGKTADAEQAFINVKELNPNYADGSNYLGFILKEQGKLAEAVGAYKMALSLKPDYAEAYDNAFST